MRIGELAGYLGEIAGYLAAVRDRSLPASRLSCASPAVSASRTGSPLVSTTACILLVNPPLDRPIDCLLFRVMQAPC